MQTRDLNGKALTALHIGLGSWAIGGWRWGGIDDAVSIRSLRSAPKHGITLNDSAPGYGFGRSDRAGLHGVARASDRPAAA